MSTEEQTKNNMENTPKKIIIEKNEPSAKPSSVMKVQQTRNDEKMKVVVRNVVREDDDCDWGARGW